MNKEQETEIQTTARKALFQRFIDYIEHRIIDSDDVITNNHPNTQIYKDEQSKIDKLQTDLDRLVTLHTELNIQVPNFDEKIKFTKECIQGLELKYKLVKDFQQSLDDFLNKHPNNEGKQ